MAEKAKTVLLHYAREADGLNVWIQGMVHVAPQAFFDVVNAEIRRFLQAFPDNGLVLLEKVQPETQDEREKAALKRQLEHIMSRITAVEGFGLERMYRLVADITGCDSQFDDRYLAGIDRTKTEIADMTTERFVECLLAQPALAGLMEQEPFKYKYRMATLEKWGRFFLFRRPAAWLLLRGLRATLQGSDPDGSDKGNDWTAELERAEASDQAFMAVVQQERNSLLIDNIGRHLAQGKNLFITYGAAHFAAKQKRQFDVTAWLETQGFRRVARRDIEVF